MIGPVPFPVPSQGQELPLGARPAPSGAEAIDNAQQSVAGRQPLELPTDKVDLTSETSGPLPRANDGSTSPSDQQADAAPQDAPAPPNSGITFRILEDLSYRIQSRVVDRDTQEVIRSIPPDQLVSFFKRFHQAGGHLDAEA